MITTFEGYYRFDGSVGTTNYWIVVPLVFCENKNVETLRDALLEPLGYSYQNPYLKMLEKLIDNDHFESDLVEPSILNEKEEVFGRRKQRFPNVNGIKFYNHTMGCGGTRQDSESFCGLIAGYITNPNVAGATILSLGCQNAQSSILFKEIAKRVPNIEKPVYVLDQQNLGTEDAMFSKAIIVTLKGLAKADTVIRRLAPLSKLCIGFACIQPSAFLKKVAEKIQLNNGTLVFPKFPKGEANPHLDTLCGVFSIMLNYPDKIQGPGTYIIPSAHGYVESITALTAAGANIIITDDSTNQLSEFAVVPVFKIGQFLNDSNDDQIEVNVFEQHFQTLLDLASGRIERSKTDDYNEDFRPWKRGVSL